MSQIFDYQGDLGSFLSAQGHRLMSMLGGGSAASYADRMIRGPIVPIDLKQESMVMLPSAVLGLYVSTKASNPAPGAAAISLASIVPYLYSKGYYPWKYGYNAQRILDMDEWYRLFTAPFIPASATLMISSVASFYPLAAHIENRRELPTLLETLGIIAVAANGIYLCAAKAAACLFPMSSLAAEYYSSYSVGWGPLIVGLQVYHGYDVDENNSSTLDHIWLSRYNWGAAVMWLQFTGTTSLYSPTPTMYASGVLAGLLATYVFGYKKVPARLQWRKKAGLGWKDFGIQMALLGLWAGVIYMAAGSSESATSQGKA